MKIIISPAKKMNIDTDTMPVLGMPQFLKETKELASYLKELSFDELKAIWKCNDKLATLNYERLHAMDVTKNITPAILSYEGLQYQYIAPHVMEEKELEYLQQHLRILSGFYGMLAPFDGVVPYRLEMQAKLESFSSTTLYEYWGEQLANALGEECNCIINLASKEYSKVIEKYLPSGVEFVTCVFCENVNGKLIEKGTFAKMARGEMVRFLAMNQILDKEGMKEFTGLGYRFSKENSAKDRYVFVK